MLTIVCCPNFRYRFTAGDVETLDRRLGMNTKRIYIEILIWLFFPFARRFGNCEAYRLSRVL